ncbi:MAG: C-GCAxxG-C-C family protein [Clostridiales bacterium]|nr:C-GCAxxG-C-C family protein [Clostridiales bacterium]
MESRVEKAKELFKSGYNCSQSVFMAYADLFDMDNATAAKISAGLGGGVGRMREVCGAVTGMTLLAGLKYGATEGDDTESKQKTYEVVRALSEEFKKTNPSIICKELLGLAQAEKSAKPEERTQEYYQKRPCVEIVGDAAKAVEKILFSE